MQYNQHIRSFRERRVFDVKKHTGKFFKNRAFLSAAAGLTAFSLLLGSLFSSPSQIVTQESLTTPPAICDTLLNDPVDDSLDSDEAVPPEKRKRRSLSEWLRQQLLRVPLLFRASIYLPLWAMGRLLLQAGALLWEPLLSPLVSGLLSCLCTAGLFLLILLGTVKTVFPDLPLKALFTRRNCFLAFFSAIGIGLAGILLQLFCPDQPRLSSVLEAGLSLCACSALILPVLCREHRARKHRLSHQAT